MSTEHSDIASSLVSILPAPSYAQSLWRIVFEFGVCLIAETLRALLINRTASFASLLTKGGAW